MTTEINAKKHHNPDPDYIRALIAKTGLQHTELAPLLGLTRQTLGRHIESLDSKTYTPIKYPTQVCLEILARQNTDQHGQPIKFAAARGAPPKNRNHPPQ